MDHESEARAWCAKHVAQLTVTWERTSATRLDLMFGDVGFFVEVGEMEGYGHTRHSLALASTCFGILVSRRGSFAALASVQYRRCSRLACDPVSKIWQERMVPFLTTDHSIECGQTEGGEWTVWPTGAGEARFSAVLPHVVGYLDRPSRSLGGLLDLIASKASHDPFHELNYGE
jgi:hypothetical protein